MEVIPAAVHIIGLQMIVLAVPLFILVVLSSFFLAVYVLKRIRQ